MALIPEHVVIIPDGNRRWARFLNSPISFGHKSGYERIKELISFAQEKGIKFITVWAFSTENWNREKDEVNDLLKIIKEGLESLIKEAKEHKTKFLHIGRKDRLGNEIIELINNLEEETKNYNDFCLCLAIDYGGEDEIKRAEDMQKENGKTVFDFLDTTLKNIPNPDLIIRTGGEHRTSGFMPLQSSYAEWIFSEKMFPDFDNIEFQKALDEYANRERRFGK
jgi:undecaprenyl diphosphate synthase